MVNWEKINYGLELIKSIDDYYEKKLNRQSFDKLIDIIIDERINNDNTKYDDEYLRRLIKTRMNKISYWEEKLVWIENDIFFIDCLECLECTDDNPYGFKVYYTRSKNMIQLMHEIRLLVKIVESF